MNALKSGLFSFLMLNLFILSAQETKKADSSQSIFFVRFEYGYYTVGGDWESHFSNSNFLGGRFGYKTRSNWQFGINGGIHFSSKVKSDGLLDGVINDAGDVIDSDGELVRLTYEQRGLSFFAQVGKVLPIIALNKNSGFIVEAGIGYFQHKIKIDYRDGTVFQLSENYLKGYDRLSTGLAFKQFIGYQYFGRRNLVNFYIGYELMQAFTKNRRGYNYDTREFDTAQKTDLLNGLKFGWTIPFRRRAAEEFYYY